jgi:hypothetical protein
MKRSDVSVARERFSVVFLNRAEQGNKEKQQHNNYVDINILNETVGKE